MAQRIVAYKLRLLITPHGDLKPDSEAAGSAKVSFAHYPSWGFETLALVTPTTQGVDSLPLMGI